MEGTTYKCFYCSRETVGWVGDFTFEDFGMDGDGAVSEWRCGNCGARILCYLPSEEDPEGDDE